MRIFDCFIFYNELDLLELRLNILNDEVDKFIICEASTTHSGQPKPFYFEENKMRFSKFLDKIIHVKIDDIPDDFENLPPIKDVNSFDGNCVSDIYGFIENTKLFNRKTEPHYGRDFFQKESIRRGMQGCSDDDIIISSDCDEIPNPILLSKIKKIIDNEKFYTLRQTTYYYYLNLLKELNWKGSRVALYKNVKDYSFNELRAQTNCEISDAGWHFSFMGGLEKVKGKIQAYSHQEMNNDSTISNLEYNISNNIDPFSRSKLELVEIDDTYPKYLVNNISKYQHMIKS